MRWRKSVEATPPDRPITTWCQIDFSKSVELPYNPINTSYGGNEDTHHILEIPLAKLPFLV
jgi:hypothetical protein